MRNKIFKAVISASAVVAGISLIYLAVDDMSRLVPMTWKVLRTFPHPYLAVTVALFFIGIKMSAGFFLLSDKESRRIAGAISAVIFLVLLGLSIYSLFKPEGCSSCPKLSSAGINSDTLKSVAFHATLFILSSLSIFSAEHSACPRPD